MAAVNDCDYVCVGDCGRVICGDSEPSPGEVDGLCVTCWLTEDPEAVA